MAAALRAVRQAMKNRKPSNSCRGGLVGVLSRAIKDSYRRSSSKQARNWPHKKREKPPGAPKLREATSSEIQQAQEIKATQMVA